MTTRRNSRALIRSIASLGANLNLRVVAEGVEDTVTLAELKQLGCHVGQGYGISRPMPAAALIRWVRAHQPRRWPEIGRRARLSYPLADRNASLTIAA